jgi:hypothetical protein
MLATAVRDGPLDCKAIRKEMQFVYHGLQYTDYAVLICGICEWLVKLRYNAMSSVT